MYPVWPEVDWELHDGRGSEGAKCRVHEKVSKVVRVY